MHQCAFPVLDLSLANDFDAMARAVDQVDAFLEQHELGQRCVYVTRLALDEILSNIIQYAYAQPGGRTISLRVELLDKELRLTFTDDGRPFDPLQVPPPDLESSLEDRPVGGLGIHMIRDMSKEMRYCRDDQHNVLQVLVPVE